MPPSIHDWKGRRVTVMGLGHFGGGTGVVRWLARQGARVTLTDLASADELAAPLSQLRDVAQEALYPIQFHLGGHDASDFTTAETLVVNPAVPPENRWVREAAAAGAAITTEIGLFLDACRGTVIGVTGSNGKSTTAAMLASILRADGRTTWLGGNLGGSLLEELASITEQDWVVLELSSFQITYLTEQARPPWIVVATGCVPNHLDWHKTFDEYAETKRRLLRLQTFEGVAVLDPSLAESDAWTQAVRGRLVPVASERDVFSFSEKDREATATQKYPDCFLKLPGEHNRRNARVAATAAREAGCGSDAIRRGLTAFGGLPGRLERVGVCRGRTCINDTASTTPESTAAAAAAFPGSWFLVGGGDKGADFSAMLESLARLARGVAFYGAVGPRLFDRFSSTLESPHGRLQNSQTPDKKLCATLEEAFCWTLSQSEPGGTILLSPGCSSHDQFVNFVARGELFKRLVREHDV